MINVFSKIKGLYKFLTKDPFYMAIRQWVKDDGDNTLRLNYPLGKESIVLDVGGYKGNWAGSINSKYGCKIFIFEPVAEFYNEIDAKFQNIKNVDVFQYGLGDSNKEIDITVQDDASSTVACSGIENELIKVRDIFDFINEKGVGEIDLVKINIEGGEYELLERMFEKDIVLNSENIQIQFHDFFPEAKLMRQNIRLKLQKTHRLTYDYYFVWENWERIK